MDEKVVSDEVYAVYVLPDEDYGTAWFVGNFTKAIDAWNAASMAANLDADPNKPQKCIFCKSISYVSKRGFGRAAAVMRKFEFSDFAV